MITYKDAGVDVGANTRWVDAIKTAMRGTYGPRVYERRFGGFAGLFELDFEEQILRRDYKRPVLVGCTDGVGTKVLMAVKMNRLNTIGIDLVAMNVNDLITCGAEPLFFLDYLATHKLEPKRLLDVIEGIAAGCKEAGCALLGGETAEMPDLYAKGHIDLAGFAVGVVEKDRIIDGGHVRAGDTILGLPSSGVHSNGYSLVRRLIGEKRCSLNKHYEELGETLGDALLRPTRIYVRAVRALHDAHPTGRAVTGMAHVTGGGLKENIARVLPRDCDAVLRTDAWKPQPVFDFLRRLGTTRAEMLKVFNMGIGFVIIVRRRSVGGVLSALRSVGEDPVNLGSVECGSQRVRFQS